MSGTVLITGAGRGIGAAIAASFVAAGWSALLVDLDPAVAETAERLDDGGTGKVRALVANVATAAGQAEICAAATAVPEPLRALVNNAGITRDDRLARMSEESFLSVLRVNLGGPLALCAGLQQSMEKGGAIVNLSSKSANGNFGQFNYAISKAGLLGLTRSLALQLAPRIRVNALAPAFIATEMTDAIPEGPREKIISRIPFGRPGEAEEVASAALWLCSPASSYVTGQVLPVCGGRSFGA